MRWFSIGLILVAQLMSVPACAGDKPDLLETIPYTVTNRTEDQFLTFAFENDLLGKGTDQNYTNGVRLTYFDLNAEFPEIAHEIADRIPTFELNRTSSVFFSIGQNLYTPDDITQREQDPKDRPWAAFAYASLGMSTMSGRHIDDLEATLGIVGPLALGEQTQKFVHRHISDSPTPKGWSNQLSNEPGLMLSWQRRWPLFLEHQAGGLLLTAAPYIGLTAGNIHTYANSGLMLRLSPSGARWEDAPLRVRPAMPGTGFFDVPEGAFNWYLFAGVEGRAVARNIFLDGNTFADSQRVDKFPLVGDATAGLAVTVGGARVSYSLVYRSKEFERQQEGDLFGAVSVSYRF